MARKLRGFERVLDAPALFAVAYGEIASSLYIALGIVAGVALGLTPLVLLVAGAAFVLVSLSYAEGTTALPEAGGAATFVRRAFNDLAGFVTGWVLFLDFLIVVALSAMFAPHYLAGALGEPALRESPWDAVIGCGLILVIAGVRILRRTRLHLGALGVALLDLLVQSLLVLLGLAMLLSPTTLVDGLGFATGQDWGDLAFALPLAMLAYTGLETVANLAEETTEPGRTLPRSLFSAIGLVVVVTVLIGAIGLSAYPVSGGETALGEEWLELPLVGIAAAFDGELPAILVDALEVAVGISGVLILIGAATTSFSGITRLTYSLAEHGSLPREFARLERRAVVSSEAIALAAAFAIVLIVVTEVAADGDPTFLASLYSFGVLIAFTAAQLAVIRLRMREPDLERPFLARPNVTIRGHRLPVAALIGAPLTFAIWILSMLTHAGARYAGPVWLAAGLVVFVLVRRKRRRGLLEHVMPVHILPAGAEFSRILVPMKLGDIGEEMVATAIALAKERGATIEAITVVRVPRKYELEGELPAEVAARVDSSLGEAQALGLDYGVEVHGDVVRARSIGHAIVDEASRRNADLIVLGSSPRWRRQSRFFSPTVDFVLRRAPCEVLVVAFPDGVFEN
ncbi:MAG TPA: universal stress protein [Gaiellaceae bacterium]|nr:universal stress protein [Gaiellaceae bacterium]